MAETKAPPCRLLPRRAGRAIGPGSSIAYETFGEGPPVICIAGFAASHVMWEPQVEDWSRERTVVLLDNRKVGESQGRGLVPWVDLMARDVLAVMDDLQLSTAAICGMSMGGFIAQKIAVRWPERVDRLILTCTAPQRPFPRPGPGPGMMFMSDDFARRHPEVRDYWIRKGRAGTAGSAIGQLIAIMSFDLRRDVPRIMAPTLVVHGTADRVVPVHHGRWLGDNIPGARIVIYEGAGHVLNIERASDYNRDVLAWLAREPTRTAGC